MARVYGNTNTHLTLTDKAQKYYELTDPIEITEHETEDGYLYSILDGGDAAGFLIGNLDSEYFFKLHKKLDGIKRIRTKVICEICGFGNL